MGFSAVYFFVGFAVRAKAAFEELDEEISQASLLPPCAFAQEALDAFLRQGLVFVGNVFRFHSVNPCLEKYLKFVDMIQFLKLESSIRNFYPVILSVPNG